MIDWTIRSFARFSLLLSLTGAFCFAGSDSRQHRAQDAATRKTHPESSERAKGNCPCDKVEDRNLKNAWQFLKQTQRQSARHEIDTLKRTRTNALTDVEEQCLNAIVTIGDYEESNCTCVGVSKEAGNASCANITIDHDRCKKSDILIGQYPSTQQCVNEGAENYDTLSDFQKISDAINASKAWWQEEIARENVHRVENAPISVLNAPQIIQPESRQVFTSEVTLFGISIPKRVVDIYIDDKMIGETEADEHGRWSFPGASAYQALRDGEHQIYVTAKENETLLESKHVPFYVDRQPPVPPTVVRCPSLSERELWGFVFQGRAQPGVSVEAFFDSKSLNTTRARDDGYWEITGWAQPAVLLSHGEHPITFEAVDKYGRKSKPVTCNLKVNAAPPGMPSVNSFPSIMSPSDLANWAFTGFADNHTAVRLKQNGQVLGSARVDEHGRWEIKPQGLSEARYGNGRHIFDFIAQDDFGHDSATAHALVTIDAIPPETPQVSPFGATLTSSELANVVFWGSGEAGSEIRVHTTTQELGRSKVQSDGRWSIGAWMISKELSERGEHFLLFDAVDEAGNRSKPQEVQFVTEIDAFQMGIDLGVSGELRDSLGWIGGGLILEFSSTPRHMRPRIGLALTGISPPIVSAVADLRLYLLNLVASSGFSFSFYPLLGAKLRMLTYMPNENWRIIQSGVDPYWRVGAGFGFQAGSFRFLWFELALDSSFAGHLFSATSASVVLVGAAL